MRIIERIRQPVAASLLVWMSACATAGGWKEVAVTPQPTKQTLYAGDVRVATAGGMVYAFRGVWVGPDSLGGWLVEPAGKEQGFALGDVTRLEVRGASRQAQPAGIEGDGDQKWFMILLGAYFAVGIVAAIAIGDPLGGLGGCCR
jgi:hypothetical protein